MLPKKIRLTTGLFDQVFKTGRVRHSQSFWLRSVPSSIGLSDKQPSRFAVAVSKKIAPSAVLRNRIKRIVYRAVESVNSTVLADQPSQMIIIGVKSDISKMDFVEIAQELKTLLLSRSRGSTAVEKNAQID